MRVLCLNPSHGGHLRPVQLSCPHAQAHLPRDWSLVYSTCIFDVVTACCVFLQKEGGWTARDAPYLLFDLHGNSATSVLTSCLVLRLALQHMHTDKLSSQLSDLPW